MARAISIYFCVCDITDLTNFLIFMFMDNVIHGDLMFMRVRNGDVRSFLLSFNITWADAALPDAADLQQLFDSFGLA